MQLSYDAVCFDLFGTLLDENARAYAGVADALATLPAQRWAIFTSGGGAIARALLSAAGLPSPRVLVSGDTVARNKPAPDGYLQAAQLMRAEPARVVVIEDTPHGIRSGRDAGMDVVAVLRGRHASMAAGALCSVDRFADLVWKIGDSGDILIDVP
jgi:mannitol-1-/sugar-/sorbitol-6-phosphatase